MGKPPEGVDMICYRDRTWCPFYETCNTGATCNRSLTPEVKEAAQRWWGGKAAPIAVFINPPGCHEEKPTEEK
jgi:hypothetical protein